MDITLVNMKARTTWCEFCLEAMVEWAGIPLYQVGGCFWIGFESKLPSYKGELQLVTE